MSTHTSSILPNSQLMVSEVAVPILKQSAAQTIKCYMENLRNSFTLKAIVVAAIALSLAVFSFYAKRMLFNKPVRIYTKGKNFILGNTYTHDGQLFLENNLSETGEFNISNTHDFRTSGVWCKQVGVIRSIWGSPKSVYTYFIEGHLILNTSESINKDLNLHMLIPQHKALIDNLICELQDSLKERDRNPLHISVTQRKIQLLEKIKAE